MNDDAERARYRAASEVLDERPSAATRAAILAAAARQVEARPRDAGSPVRPPQRPAAMRWPWAAAATVLLSTLAVMMATQTEREMPTFTPPASAPPASATAERAAPASDSQGQPALVAPPPPATTRSVPASPAIENKQRSAQSAAGNGVDARAERDAVRQDRSTAASPPREAADAASGVASEEHVRAKQETAEQRANEAAASTAPAPAGTLMKRSAPAAKPDASSTVERQLDESAVPPSVPPAVSRAPAAPSSAELGAASDRAREAELNAEDWLKRIVALRASGRHDEADAELKRFRERYPQVQVPPAALPPSGTR
jgi:hypothetical protein